ncbi:uncharacterized protein KQ657_004919 [Scheffersomyces spartinae]|uniref:Myosin-binding domain-containing protein n=1 Tax=Scheffersomyces spartinae TaxID=45513 RepID=A0A9P8AJK2_9ASCO|nr:uncharacterized protein KQ657_004919 [Scheffersomyces spartinae]KAG7194207.1 hypothetical protein KQ657_004919 [Scheffersomyces spartinae]
MSSSTSNTRVTTNLHRIYEDYDTDTKPVPVDVSMIERFIRKYFQLNKLVDQFWDKLKYNIVLSTLLDDTMIPSKNDQAMKELLSRETVSKQQLSGKYIRYDGCTLSITRTYKLGLPSTSIFALVFAIIHMLKRILIHNKGCSPSRHMTTLFKILLVYGSRYFQYTKLRIECMTTKITNLMNTFFKWNYKLNKKLITNLLALKELTMFSFLNTTNTAHTSTPTDPKAQQLYHLLDSSLSVLIVNLKATILKILPLMNGDIFEKYCQINTINFPILLNQNDNEVEINMDMNNNNYVSSLTTKLAQFNQLRKLLFCQILSLNEVPKSTFFLSKLHDEFTNSITHLSESPLFPDTFFKLGILKGSLVQLSSLLESMVTSFVGYEECFPLSKPNFQDEDILGNKLTVITTTDDLIHLDNLIDKISNLTSNFKFFKKYHKSTAGNFDTDELNEKLNIFNQFINDIEQIRELHQLSLQDLSLAKTTDQLSSSSPALSTSTSTRNSSDFPLKSFQNSSLKKRLSLPSNNNRHYSIIGGLPASSASPTSSDLQDNNNSEKKYKKLSAGLQLGLLTVVKEAKNGVSYDDNYLNTAPSPFETYNKATLDQLQRSRNSGIDNNHNTSTSRFSLYSVASNMSSAVSDLVSTTQITEYESGRGANPSTGDEMTKEQLKLKLEESFNRIYNLEKENDNLRSTSTKEAANQEDQFSIEGTMTEHHDDDDDDRGDTHNIPRQPNMGFINELEKTLESVVIKDINID